MPIQSTAPASSHPNNVFDSFLTEKAYQKLPHFTAINDTSLTANFQLTGEDV
jgi:hypothetical protein